MLEITDDMVTAVLNEIHKHLDGWTTPDTFEDYVEDECALVFLEIIADCHWGWKIHQRVAEWMEVTVTDEDMEYDFGVEAVEEAADKLAETLNKKIEEREPDLVGHVYFGTNEHSGDYGLLYCVEVDELPYPEDK
jgi:hypothetical protein